MFVISNCTLHVLVYVLDPFVEKAFHARLVVLCLDDNQQSYPVMVIGVQINLGLKPRLKTLSSPSIKLSYLSKHWISISGANWANKNFSRN